MEIPIEVNRMDLPEACTKKYLIAADVENWVEFKRIKGINEIKLSSNPIHTTSQLILDRIKEIRLT